MRTTIRGLRRLIEASFEKNKDFYLKAGTSFVDEIEPELVNMVTKSYEKVGGNHKIRSSDDISTEYSDLIVADVDDDPDIDVFVGGNQRNGMKLGVTATDGSGEAKSHLMALKKQLFTNGWWAEVSDAPAHITLNKLGIKPIEDEMKVRSLLGDRKITWFGAHPEGKFPGTMGWYERDIGGTPHAKIIVGDV
jgi:hypothetical protein